MLRIILIAALAGLSWFNFVNEAPAHVLAREVLDTIDERPARRLLFVGNSRMFGNDMPYMIRAMADSAGAPHKYQVRMWALPGASFESHWRAGEVQKLLARRNWDGLVLQAESRAHFDDESRASFATYGRKLVAAADQHGVPTALVVNWMYGPPVFEGSFDAQAAQHRKIQSDHRELAKASGAALANVGGAWRAAVAADLPFPLDTDGNHPSVHGSYLSALIIYAHLSGTDASSVTYAPGGVSEAEAAMIRRIVADFVRSRIDA